MKIIAPWLEFKYSRKQHMLSECFWAEASVLAAARLNSNNNRRAKKRDRQKSNPLVDLMGAASELLLYRMIARRPTQYLGYEPSLPAFLPDLMHQGMTYMQKNLFVSSGGSGITGPDLLIGNNDTTESFDAKSFDFGVGKSRFAINSHGLNR